MGRASRLVRLTLGYNVLEAVVALWAGEASGSIALVGFGLDSVIEMVAAGVVLWRLSVAGPSLVGADGPSQREQRATRVVGWTFLALALYVGVEATLLLVQARAPEASAVGITLAALSLVVMPVLAWRKTLLARELESAALLAEARETLACAYLSACLLGGLSLHALLGWWWADSMAALLMVPWLVAEGREAIRGEGRPADPVGGVPPRYSA